MNKTRDGTESSQHDRPCTHGSFPTGITHDCPTNWNLAGCYGARVDRRLAPRVYEGGATSAHTGGGGVRIPGCRALNRIIFLYLPSLFLVLFCERYVGDELSPVPVCATLTTPLTSAGARPCTVSTPIATAQTSLQIPNLYSCCVKPIRTFRYSLSGLQTNA